MKRFLLLLGICFITIFSLHSFVALQADAQSTNLDSINQLLLELNSDDESSSPVDLESLWKEIELNSSSSPSQIESAFEKIEEIKINSVAIKTNPQNPKPYERVVVYISSYSLNLREADISWSVNGELIKSGRGLTSFQTQLGGVGELIRVEAEITSVEVNKPFTRRIAFAPNEVDLLWEAVDAHTPPFYRGKALPSWDSLVRVTTTSSIFNGTGQKVNPKDLVYTWSLDGMKSGMSAYSGYGRNTAYARAGFLGKNHTVAVEITSQLHQINSSSSITYIQKDPQIIFYKKEPLAGIDYENALGARVREEKNSSVTLVAEPYSFDMRNGFAGIVMDWKMNKDPIPFIEEMSWGEIPLVTQASGKSKLNLKASAAQKLQQASVDLEIVVD